MMRAVIVLLISLLCLGSAQGGKLLVIPLDGSPWRGMKLLVEELGRRGHQVVVVIPEVSHSLGPSKNTTTLTFSVPYTQESFDTDLDEDMFQFMTTDVSTDVAKFRNYWSTLDTLSGFTIMTCESMLYNKELMQTLRDYEFDALLTDPFWPVGVIIGNYLDIPSVYMSGPYPCPLDIISTRCPHPASYLPQRFTHYSNRMTLWERTVNLLRSVLEPAACSRLYAHADKMASDFLQKDTSIVELASNAALWLVRFDFTYEFPMPLMPNMVMIGGMKAGKPKPLPQVSHPKAKAFITHGGTHGIYEGIYSGVPMVTIPLFIDQGDNAQRMVARGVAESLPIADVTTAKVLEALNKVIGDKSYKANMMKLSAVHKDRPIEPLDLAVFWTEFVMRHKGADHLRSTAHELSWVQYHSLDVIALLTTAILTLVLVTIKCCTFCFRKCTGKSNKTKIRENS
ncbi:UDP-glucuronosyltransferase 1-6-like [Sardina pilchardus]|uniref:UDP-glucuronosyltransferase 1-6-like n=1 Tax=Sardina pilchardus TaxID=27697 RepID=UPI002E13A112